MRFSRKIAPDIKTKQNFITKKRLREDQINFEKLRSSRLSRVRKELEKNNLEACILFDPVNVRYALDSLNIRCYFSTKSHFTLYSPNQALTSLLAI